MEYFIPKFIYDNFLEQRFEGEFEAGTMFVDIMGFTSITDSLKELGKEGEEIISDTINKLFNPAIRAIYSKNGWISSFAGDAFTAIFHIDDIEGIIDAAKEIEENISNLFIQTKKGKFKFSVKVGLAYGQIKWKIFNNKIQAVYHFYGEGIEKCIKAQKTASNDEIVLSKNLLTKLEKRIDYVQKGEEYFILQRVNYSHEKNYYDFPDKYKDEVKKRFFNHNISENSWFGEFRNIVPVFMSFEKTEDLDRVIDFIINRVSELGGYLNKLDFGDKGTVLLVIFGAPVGIEKPVLRAAEFAVDMKSVVLKKVKAKIGINMGIGYAGMIGSKQRMEYTVIGNVVNIAARLMESNDWGSVYITGEIDREIENAFKTRFLGKINLKGISDKVPVYILEGKENIKEKLFKGEMVGRIDEFESIMDIIKSIDNKRFSGIIYVEGDIGIGKSRMVTKVKRSLDQKFYNWFYMPCDEILKNSFNPVVYWAKHYFEQKDSNSKEENKKNFEKKMEYLIENTKDTSIRKELVRTASILGAIVNIYWEGSLYEKLSPKDRFDGTLYALKNLIKAESLIKPLIIEIEDGHCIDNDTVEFLEVLTLSVEEFPFAIITSCRPESDNKEFKFGMINDVTENVIMLGELGKEDSYMLISDRIGGNAGDKLLESVWIKGEGNPLFMEQIIYYLKENDLLSLKNDVFELKDENFLIPNKINSIIMSRIDRLGQELKNVIKAAAVLGKEFSAKVLAEMLEYEDIQKYMKIIEEENIWFPMSEMLYIFKHSLIRDIAYDMQLKKDLKTMHKIAAKSIEDVYKNELPLHFEELAYHYEKCENSEKALEFFQKAGDYAFENYKNKMAVYFYDKFLQKFDNNLVHHFSEKALDVEHFAKGIILIDVLLKKATCLKNMEDRHAATEVAKQALLLSEKVKDKDRIGKVNSFLGLLHTDETEFEEALEYYDRAIWSVRDSGNGYYLSEFLLDKAEWMFLFGKVEESDYINQESMQVAKEVDRKDCIFRSTILDGKIKYERTEKEIEKKRVIDRFEFMVEMIDNRDDKARLNFELFRLYMKIGNTRKGEAKRKEALFNYKCMYEEKPKYEYKKIIEELLAE